MAMLKESKKGGRISQPIVYCIGGYNAKEARALKEVERYDCGKEMWEQVADMNIARINPGACSVGSTYIYIFGGRS